MKGRQICDTQQFSEGGGACLNYVNTLFNTSMRQLSVILQRTHQRTGMKFSTSAWSLTWCLAIVVAAVGTNRLYDTCTISSVVEHLKCGGVRLLAMRHKDPEVRVAATHYLGQADFPVYIWTRKEGPERE